MGGKKVIVIYESRYLGNTKKVAGRIAEVLEAELLPASKVLNLDSLKKYDLLGFGSGIYFSVHHKNLLELAEKMPHADGKKGFIFSTSGLGKIAMGPYHGELRRRLNKKGLKIVGEFSCKGHDNWGLPKLIGGINWGRPNKHDLRKAEEFAHGLKKHLGRV